MAKVNPSKALEKTFPTSISGNRPISHQDLIATFFSGRNPRTLRGYKKDLDDFRIFTQTPTIKDATRVLFGKGQGFGNAIALRYRANLKERKLSAATINRRLAALRSLVKFARTVGIVPWNLEIENVTSQPFRDTKGPGVEGFRNLLEKLGERDDGKAIRDRAILRLLFDLGLRRMEVVSLDLEDVDIEADTVAIIGKGKSEKVKLTLPPETRMEIQEWQKIRGEEPGPLFTNFDRARKGNRLTGKSIYRMVRSLGESIGMKVWPHGLRHASITTGLDATGGNLRAVQKFARHANIKTTMIYDDNRRDLAGMVAKKISEIV